MWAWFLKFPLLESWEDSWRGKWTLKTIHFSLSITEAEGCLGPQGLRLLLSNAPSAQQHPLHLWGFSDLHVKLGLPSYPSLAITKTGPQMLCILRISFLSTVGNQRRKNKTGKKEKLGSFSRSTLACSF